MNFRTAGAKINIICKRKYLGIMVEEHLLFKCHLEKLKLKLNRTRKRYAL